MGFRHHLAGPGVADGVRDHRAAIRSSHNPSIFIFWLERGGRWGSIDQPGQSSEVEHNPKMSIFFFGWRGVVIIRRVQK